MDDRLIRTGQTTLAWGHSLGGFVCADIANKAESIDAIVLETAAQNIDEVVDARTPKLIKPFIRPRINEALQEYDVIKSLKDFDGPILVLGAGQDEILEVDLARDLAERLKLGGANIRYVEFPNASHEGIPWEASFQMKAFKDTTHSFLLGW